MNDKEKFFKEFNEGLHRIGRITLILGAVLLIAVPFILAMLNDASIDFKGFLKLLRSIGVTIRLFLYSALSVPPVNTSPLSTM